MAFENNTVDINNIIVKDGVRYDLNIQEQKDAYDLAYDETSGWMKNLVNTVNSSNTKREYYASNLSSTPIHPNRSDFGYENLITGSTIFEITTSTVYMFDEKASVNGDWIML